MFILIDARSSPVLTLLINVFFSFLGIKIVVVDTLFTHPIPVIKLKPCLKKSFISIANDTARHELCVELLLAYFKPIEIIITCNHHQSYCRLDPKTNDVKR